MRFQTKEIRSQDEALRELVRLVKDGQEDPYVVTTARKIVAGCPSRDDLCELDAIFRAVKEGDPDVEPLKNGVAYRSDPRSIDFFSGASRILKMCEAGACGMDCDEHSILNASLAGALGFKTGLRAYGPDPDKNEFTHIYAVALVPKRKSGVYLSGFGSNVKVKVKGDVVAMDTTVPQSYLGWEPPPGRTRTAFVPED